MSWLSRAIAQETHGDTLRELQVREAQREQNARKPTTMQALMQRAERTDPEYVFEDEEEGRIDPRVVPIPISLDDRRDTLVALQNHLVEMEAEEARIAEEIKNTKDQIQTHKIAFSKTMLEMQIPAPMASELPPTLPKHEEET